MFSSELESLGGERILGRQVRNSGELGEAIRQGFPPRVLDSLMESSGLTLREIAESLDIPIRTLQRHRNEGRLAPSESDRLYRLAHVMALAVHYLGDREAAMDWLRYPLPALGGVPPLRLLDTDPGLREVERILGRIAYGGIS